MSSTTTGEWVRPPVPPAPGAPPRRPSPPRVDPRMRERWIAARRAEGRRRLRLVVASASVAGVVGLSAAVLESPLTAVHRVVISGARHETAAQVEAVAGVHRGRQLAWIDTGAAVRRLDSLPWVARATVDRRWPGTVTIALQERQAVAQVAVAAGGPVAARGAAPPAGGPGATAPASGDLTVLVDGSGRVLTAPAPRVPALPVVTGVGAPGRPGTWVAVTDADAGVLAVAALLPPALAARVSSISEKDGVITAQVLVAPPEASRPGAGSAAVTGTTGTTGAAAASPAEVPATLGTATDLDAKVTDLATVVAQVDLSRVTGIDLTIPGRPVLTGSPAPTNVSTIAGG